MQTASEDLYVILGVHKTATNEEIKKSYHKLALKNLDSIDEAEVKFKTVAEAFFILSDPERRRKYDLYGTKGDQQGPGSTGRAPQDIFESFFTSQASPAGSHHYSSQQQQNNRYQWTQANNTRQPPQPTHGQPYAQPQFPSPPSGPAYGSQPQGTGAVPSYGSQQGSGTHVYGAGSATQTYGQTQYHPPSYAHYQPSMPKAPSTHHQYPQQHHSQPQTQPQTQQSSPSQSQHYPQQKTPPDPEIQKNLPNEISLSCTLEELYRGEDKKVTFAKTFYDKEQRAVNMVEKTLDIKVAPGWKDEGDVYPGVPPSDVVVTVKELSHPVFIRERNNLRYKVTLQEALCGVFFSITHLDGQSIDIWVDEIIHPGYTWMVPGRGFRSSRSSEYGNLIVDFEVLFPIVLNAEERDILAGGPLSRCAYPSPMDVEHFAKPENPEKP